MSISVKPDGTVTEYKNVTFNGNVYPVEKDKELSSNPNLKAAMDSFKAEQVNLGYDVIFVYGDGTEVKLTDKVSDDITIKAVIVYNITYELGGKGTLPADAPAKYTAEELPLALKSAESDEYDFEGWYDNAEFSGNAIEEVAEGTKGNLKLYAKWSELAKLAFENEIDSAANTLTVKVTLTKVPADIDEIRAFTLPVVRSTHDGLTLKSVEAVHGGTLKRQCAL